MRFLKVLSMSLVAQAMLLCVGFANNIIITRNLDLESRGQYALTMNTILILSLLLGDGLFRSNTYLVSVDRKKLTHLISNSIVAIVVFVSVLVVFFSLFSKDIFTFLIPGLTPGLIWLAVVSVIPFIFIRSMNGLFLGMQSYYLYNFFVVAPLFLYMIFNVGLYLRGFFSPELIMRNYFFAMTGLFIVCFVLLRKFAPYRFEPNRAVGRESIRSGLRSSASSVSLFMLFRVDIFLINYFLGTDQAGLYSIAVILSELLQKFANTAGTVLFPKVAGEQKVSTGHRLSLRVLLLVSIVGMIFAALLVIFGHEIIVLLYKERYAAAVSPLMWLLPGTVVMALGKIFMFSLWGRGFPPSTYIVPLCALVLNAVLNTLLIPRYGIDGAAISTSFSYCVFGVILAIVYYYHVRAGFLPKR